MIDNFESLHQELSGSKETKLTRRRIVPFRFEKEKGAVNINIIESPHDTPEDTEFILDALKDISPGQTLFVEQGSPNQKDHIVFQLKKIASTHPDIQEDFSQRGKYTWTILEGQENNPFAIASEYFLSCSRGGMVINMDLSARVDRAALDFIIQESSLEFALEHAYKEVREACFNYQGTIPKILKLLFPEISEKKIEYACQQLYKTYQRIDYSLKRSKVTRHYWNYLREKYMRQTLEEQACENDFVLCHPNHAEKIKTPRSKIVVPEKPENLFKF